MTLQVSFDQFPETVRRLLNQEEAYVAPHDAGTIVTAARPEKPLVIAAVSPVTPEVATASLTSSGLVCREGTWLTPEEVLSPMAGAAQTYIAAVAYRSASDKAGLWVDAFPALPSQLSVLKAMYEEFRTTGEVEDVGFDEFIQLANANVVILTPSEVESFVRQKQEC